MVKEEGDIRWFSWVGVPQTAVMVLGRKRGGRLGMKNERKGRKSIVGVTLERGEEEKNSEGAQRRVLIWTRRGVTGSLEEVGSGRPATFTEC